MVLAQLKPDTLDYEIHTSEIELITGRKWNITQLTDSTENLLGRVFQVETPDKFRQLVLFQYFDYLKGTRTIQLKLSEVALPYFFELKNNFTVLQLKSVLSCSSKYAKRLYALACQWRTAGGVIYEISELKEMLGLIDKKTGKQKFKQFSDFQTKVLDIAKKQINENTDITFDYTLIKKGRSYTKIKIFAGSAIPKQLSIDFTQDLEKQKSNAELIRKIDAIKAIGIRDDLAELWGVKYWKQYVEEKNKMLEEIKKGKEIKDFPAYLAGVFKRKGYL
jgi:plasmid replication initiation protein